MLQIFGCFLSILNRDNVFRVSLWARVVQNGTIQNMRQKLFICIFLIGSVVSAFAQGLHKSDTVSMRVYYRQGYSTFDPLYKDNEKNLQRFLSQVRSIQQDSMARIRTMRIVAGASPEGSYKANQVLSQKRAASIATVLGQYMPEMRDFFRIEPVGIDWGGLEQLVAQSDMPYRDDVLSVLRNTPEWVIKDGVVVDSRKRQLGMMHNGKAWWYMYDHFFPELRGAGGRIVCEVEYVPEPVVPIAEPIVKRPADSVIRMPDPVIEQPEPVTVHTPQPFYMALKTNLLYDVALVPNLGIEFYVGSGWSLTADGMFAWWKTDKKHYYWRVYGGEFSVRKYFGRAAQQKPLSGHHLGLYGQLLTYDFELGGTGYLSKLSYGGGIEYGYSFPIGRRFNLDLGVGVGYLGGEYKKYVPMDDHYVWQQTRQRHWIGPTKAEISLVWLIGRGNYNKRK